MRLRFRADAGVAEELDALAATERGCCAWATWTVTTAPATASSSTSGSSGDGIAALRSMFAERGPT